MVQPRQNITRLITPHKINWQHQQLSWWILKMEDLADSDWLLHVPLSDVRLLSI